MRTFFAFCFFVLAFGLVGYLVGVENSARFCDFNAECLHPLLGYSQTTAKLIGTILGAYAGATVGALTLDR